MKKTKQQPLKQIKKKQFAQTYQFSPPYHFSRQNISDSLSKTSIISSPKESKNASVNLNIQPASNNQHLVELYDNISNNGDITIVDDADLQPLALYVRETKQRATLQKNFDQADNLNGLLSSIKSEISNRNKNVQDQLNIQRANYEAADVKNMNDEMRNYHAHELQEFDNDTDQIINEAISSQQSEQNSFEYNWENTKTYKYRKPSSSLLQMKEIEKSAIIAGDVSKARQMHEEIEKQTQKEADLQIQKFNQDYQKMKNRLMIKQQQEMERIRQNREELRQIIVTRHELDKEVCEKRINVLNNKDSSTTKQIKSNASEPGTEIYGCSLFHIMQETKFKIDPLLPELPSQKNKTGSSVNSKSSNNSQNYVYRSRPNSTASKRRASVQVGNYNLTKFKWTLAPSNDPKYRTKTEDLKVKKKNTIKYVKKPVFNIRLNCLSPDQIEKKSSNYDDQKNENLNEKENISNQQNIISNSTENDDAKVEKQNKKYEASDTIEIKFPLDDERSNIEIKNDEKEIESQNKNDSQNQQTNLDSILNIISSTKSKTNNTSNEET